jgi:hypothetical protein
MTTQTLDELLVSDIDDLTELAANVRPDARSALLYAVAEGLRRPALQSRLKLIRFVQALAASSDSLDDAVADSVVVPLIAATHADDPTERLAALRSLAVVAAHMHTTSPALRRSVLPTFEEARSDSVSEIRALANELLRN